MTTATIELPNIKLFTAAETAQALRVSKSYISVIVASHKLKAVRQGNRLYFREQDIAQYLVECGTTN